MEYENIEDLYKEIDHLEESKELLKELWSEFGPYDNKLPMGLKIKMQRYFEFDDSRKVDCSKGERI
jgi:hypothetical protein